MTLRSREVLLPTLLAAGILAITMGIRQSLGLLVGPMEGSLRLGLVTISFAMAVGQFAWGIVQPLAGAMSDRYGPRPVLLIAIATLCAGLALTPFVSSSWGLVFSLGLLTQMGAGAAGFSVLLSAASQRLPVESRGPASGVINAGGSFGQFIFAPLLQKLIQAFGWMSATWSMALIALTALPMVGRLAAAQSTLTLPEPTAGNGTLAAIREAFGDRSYWLLHAGFFTCGFHIAFLVTHLPGEVNLCGLSPIVASASLAIIGLFNILGSLYVGTLVTRYRSKYVLAAMYGSRAILIGGYLMLPTSPLTFYIFAAGLGFTWLSTVTPTATLVGKLFGVRYLGTLFGLTLFSHQIGGFLGAWLGGLAMVEFGSYDAMWYADIVLAALAALINLPIREDRGRDAMVE